MTLPFGSPARRWKAWRALALVAFAAQGAVAFSPVLEAHRAGKVGVHVEQEGARHVGPHDEATCTVCAVRLVHSAPAPRAVLTLVTTPRQSAVAAGRRSAPSRVATLANLTRAPPALPG